MGFIFTGDKEAEVNSCLESAVNAFARHFGENLKGLYLHGSMAMGCFRPWSSDIDLLAVVHQPVDTADKLALVSDIMAIADGGSERRSIEFSVITAAEALRAQHPIQYILHYSSGWHQAFLDGKADPVITGGGDDDLAAHLTVIRSRGVMLLGADIADAFGQVSREDYLKSVWYDIAAAEADIGAHPMYVTLNLCRTLYYLTTGFVGSKLEGGRWALGQPALAAWSTPVSSAIYEYTEGIASIVDRDELQRFAADMIVRISRFMTF